VHQKEHKSLADQKGEGESAEEDPMGEDSKDETCYSSPMSRTRRWTLGNVMVADLLNKNPQISDSSPTPTPECRHPIPLLACLLACLLAHDIPNIQISSLCGVGTR
jgi:hypothetical protein